MDSEIGYPINIGSDESISINDLVKMIACFDTEDDIPLKHIDGPQGVRGRNSENTLIEESLGWRPRQPLRDGIQVTYNWIKNQIR